mgnify:CR=1 FL=1
MAALVATALPRAAKVTVVAAVEGEDGDEWGAGRWSVCLRAIIAFVLAEEGAVSCPLSLAPALLLCPSFFASAPRSMWQRAGDWGPGGDSGIAWDWDWDAERHLRGVPG